MRGVLFGKEIRKSDVEAVKSINSKFFSGLVWLKGRLSFLKGQRKHIKYIALNTSILKKIYIYICIIPQATTSQILSRCEFGGL